MPGEEEAEASRIVAVTFVDSCCCGNGHCDGLTDRALRGEGAMVLWSNSAGSLVVSGCVVVPVDLITVSLFSELLSLEVAGDAEDAIVLVSDDEKEDSFCIPSSSNELGLLPQETV